MYDLVASFWILLWLTLTSYGLYLLWSEDRTAAQFYFYGKNLDTFKKKGLLRFILLPKKYFVHFYTLSLLTFSSSFIIICLYYTPSRVSSDFHNLLINIKNHVLHCTKIESINSLELAISSLFTVILMIIQSSRRLYESLLVSVYSQNSNINIIHYLFGLTFYVVAALSTLCPVLFSNTSQEYQLINLLDGLVSTRRAIVFVLFIYVSMQQHKCHRILADLRKDKTGHIISDKHFAPFGGLFEYVSCPHFLLEVITYLLIVIVQEFKNYYWNLIFILVLSTQTINSVIDHRWYKKKYKDYPKSRKAIIPKLL